ncbi:AI-2E family transporter [Rhodobacteraceae bacterium N5(2021)]|uniref:AI-2E family transporter n=1 Tax=Gymnodinialimonas phycosphaerae TaxID=2841589 RepID=A0A975TU47_9RHOB|nr:AI-2E family transporter [Gymnodinialimonas phycosphaerae]MBY4895100.1 AI-2E family transporter [Gymnodinialimonas phycosphaerae]
MALPARQQVTYWSIAAVVFLLLLWVLGNVIMPFIVGGAIAYFLDPIADRLERMGCSRALATTLIFVLLILIVVTIALAIIPLLVEQSSGLIEAAPGIFDNLRVFLTERFPNAFDEGSPVQTSLVNLGETIQSRGAELLQTVLSSAAGVVNVIVFIVVVPVVAFYMLLDWDRMVARIDQLLPRDHAPTVRLLASRIDRTLASFVRGQGTVCLVLGTFYAVALMIVGLQFGLVVGLIAGLLTFIPYVGALVGGALAIGLALFQFWGEWWMILSVIIIFMAGQAAEGNVLTPKLVGSSVGLHPVWLIFALSAFGTVFGFVGMLVAVPVAAVIGVLVRYFVEQYQAGLLYQGIGASAAPPQDPSDPEA